MKYVSFVFLSTACISVDTFAGEETRGDSNAVSCLEGVEMKFYWKILCVQDTLTTEYLETVCHIFL